MQHSFPELAVSTILKGFLAGRFSIPVKCTKCQMKDSVATAECPGQPPTVHWLQAINDGICDYVGGQWVDWTGKPVNTPEELREREARFMARQQAQGRRRPDLQRKMEMEDMLLQDKRYNHFNPRPFDD